MKREDDTEELRNLLRYADQGRKNYGDYRSSDRQVNELASLLGSIEGTNLGDRPSRPSLSSTTVPPQPPARTSTAGSLNTERNYRPSQVTLRSSNICPLHNLNMATFIYRFPIPIQCVHTL